MAWISESESTVKVAALVPKVTAVAPVKFDPRMSTLVPTGPLIGVNQVIDGAPPSTANEDELQALPPGVATEIGPVLPPLGTVA